MCLKMTPNFHPQNKQTSWEIGWSIEIYWPPQIYRYRCCVFWKGELTSWLVFKSEVGMLCYKTRNQLRVKTSPKKKNAVHTSLYIQSVKLT